MLAGECWVCGCHGEVVGGCVLRPVLMARLGSQG